MKHPRNLHRDGQAGVKCGSVPPVAIN